MGEQSLEARYASGLTNSSTTPIVTESVVPTVISEDGSFQNRRAKRQNISVGGQQVAPNAADGGGMTPGADGFEG